MSVNLESSMDLGAGVREAVEGAGENRSRGEGSAMRRTRAMGVALGAAMILIVAGCTDQPTGPVVVSLAGTVTTSAG
jgi:hypothetical protein